MYGTQSDSPTKQMKTNKQKAFFLLFPFFSNLITMLWAHNERKQQNSNRWARSRLHRHSAVASTAQGAPGAGSPESNSSVLEEQLKLMSWRMCLSARGSGDQSPRTRKPQFCCASQPPGSDHSKDLLKALPSSNTSVLFLPIKKIIYISVCVYIIFDFKRFLFMEIDFDPKLFSQLYETSPSIPSFTGKLWFRVGKVMKHLKAEGFTSTLCSNPRRQEPAWRKASRPSKELLCRPPRWGCPSWSGIIRVSAPSLASPPSTLLTPDSCWQG